MRLLTWNVNGLDDEQVDERAEAAVFTAVLGAPLAALQRGATPHEPPDVIVFQEVTPRTFKAHFTRHLAAGAYTVLPEKAPERETFEMIAVRQPWTITSFEVVDLAESVFARRLSIAELAGPDGGLRLLTAHFDSGTQNGASRLAALHQVSARMGHGPAVFAGDANLRKAEWEQARSALSASIVDVWEALGEPPSTRFTWRRTTNGEEYKARFDRVFLADGVQAVSMSPIGDPSPSSRGAAPISDHIGLLVDLTLTTRPRALSASANS